MWSRGYFAVTTGTLNTVDVQKYIEEQEMHHESDNFKISEFCVHSFNPLCKRELEPSALADVGIHLS